MASVKPESLRNALAFMERAQLSGKEVPAFVDAYQAVNAVIKSFEEPIEFGSNATAN